MALQQRLSLSPKLSQRLVLTPAMQQAIKLLPLTTLELADVINQEMVENPLLEEIPDDELAGPAPETDSEGADGSSGAEAEFDADVGGVDLSAESVDLSPPEMAAAVMPDVEWMTAGHWVALMSICLSIGRGVFLSSTLRKRFIAGDVPGAAEEIGRWCYVPQAAGMVSCPELVARRARERGLFLNG